MARVAAGAARWAVPVAEPRLEGEGGGETEAAGGVSPSGAVGVGATTAPPSRRTIHRRVLVPRLATAAFDAGAADTFTRNEAVAVALSAAAGRSVPTAAAEEPHPDIPPNDATTAAEASSAKDGG